MIHYSNCPVCLSNEIQTLFSTKDFTVTGEIFPIAVCNNCTARFTQDIPAASAISKYYNSKNYVSHSETNTGIINKLYHAVRNYTLKSKIKLIEGFVSRGTILDYGCGTGMFLSVIKNAGWDTYGMEPDGDARKIAIENGANVFSDKIKLELIIKDKKLNVITLWHVLEHVTDMSETLAFFKSKLNQEGILIIAVPNYISYDAKYYKEYWAAYDVPRHLHHFELKSMKDLVEKAGFVLQETRPMKFDSFYVSMLSEKYKTGSVNLLKAFWIGLQSNLKAKNRFEYSSTIYVFKPNI